MAGPTWPVTWHAIEQSSMSPTRDEYITVGVILHGLVDTLLLLYRHNDASIHCGERAINHLCRHTPSSTLTIGLQRHAVTLRYLVCQRLGYPVLTRTGFSLFSVTLAPPPPDTPQYAILPEVPLRIAEAYGRASFDGRTKYLALLREPVGRAISSWEYKTDGERVSHI